jgi:hypothetical protein
MGGSPAARFFPFGTSCQEATTLQPNELVFVILVAALTLTAYWLRKVSKIIGADLGPGKQLKRAG